MGTKISQLGTATTVTASDLIQVVDIEDPAMSSTGTNKKATAQLLANELGKLTSITATGSSASRSLKDRFADTVNVKDFGATGNGVTDDTAAFIAFIEYLSVNNVQGYCPRGTYAFNSQHILFSGKNNIKVICDDNAVFFDKGRIITGANSSLYRIPWGIEFLNCSNIQWIGGKFYNEKELYEGSSSGVFNSTNYTIRKPVLQFYNCKNVKLSNVKLSGNPSVGISSADTVSIISSLGLTPTPLEYAYFNLRSAFMNMYNTVDVVVEDMELVGDTCSREQITFAGCSRVSVVRPKSISIGTNFASMGKVINCNNVVISEIKAVDTNDTSLWDVSGKNITIKDSHVDFVNGKFLDITHEWGPANVPSDNILITDCSTTGRGILNVAGSSTQAQIESNPITNVVVRNFLAQTAKTNWSSNVEWVRLSTAISYSIHGGSVRNGSIGYTHAYNGGQNVSLYGVKFRWTVSAASLSVNARSFTISTQANFYNCDFDADATGSGVASLAINGNVGVPVKFIGCIINDTVFETSNPDVEFIDCVINNSSISASGGGTYKYTNCVIDGVSQSTSLLGGVASYKNAKTNLSTGDVYGGLEFKGDDQSTGAAGTRASITAVAHGDTGQAHFRLLTSASGTSAQSTVYLYAGAGVPEGVFTAPVGSVYLNTSGGATTTLYVKTSGTGNTGWTAK